MNQYQVSLFHKENQLHFLYDVEAESEDKVSIRILEVYGAAVDLLGITLKSGEEPETVEVKNFEITYFKKQHFNVEVDESHLHLIEAYDYQEAMDKFAELEIGHLWSVDEIVMAQSSFTNKLSADFFLGSMNKHNLGKVEEKGSRNFVVHYPQYQQAPKNW